MTIRYPELRDAETAKRLWAEHGGVRAVARAVGCDQNTARKWLERAGIPEEELSARRNQYTMGGEPDAVELEPESERLSVQRQGDTEIFLIDGVSYRIPFETKEEIFALYSDDGAGVQIAEIERRFEIPRSAFNAIKSYWGLTHSSPMWPDETITNEEPDVLVARGIANKKRLLHKKFKAEENRFYRKEYERLAHREMVEDRVVELAKEILEGWEPPNIIVPYRRSTSARRLYLGLSDWHVGKKTLDLVASPGFDKNILRERVGLLQEGLVEVIRDVSHSIEEIIVSLHGDMVDNPLGTTYPRQDRGQDLHDWNQMLEAATLLGDFLYFVASQAKRVHVSAVPGNHGETFDVAAAHMAAQRLSKCEHVTVDIADKRWAVIDRGRNRFIATHGDKIGRGARRENAVMKTVMMHMRPGARHYVTFGHLHHRDMEGKLTKEGTGYEWIQIPSMVGGDEYSEGSFQATSRPAQLALMVDDEKGVLFTRNLYVD